MKTEYYLYIDYDGIEEETLVDSSVFFDYLNEQSKKHNIKCFTEHRTDFDLVDFYVGDYIFGFVLTEKRI